MCPVDKSMCSVSLLPPSVSLQPLTLQSNMALVWTGLALATLLPTFTGWSRHSIRSCRVAGAGLCVVGFRCMVSVAVYLEGV